MPAVTEPALTVAAGESVDAAPHPPSPLRLAASAAVQAAPWWLVAPAVLAAIIAVLPVWYLLVRTGSLSEALDQLLTVGDRQAHPALHRAGRDGDWCWPP